MKWLKWKDLSKSKRIRAAYTLICVLIAGFMQASIIQIFMRPMNLLSSGFTGLAILIEKITSAFAGFSFWFIGICLKQPSPLCCRNVFYCLFMDGVELSKNKFVEIRVMSKRNICRKFDGKILQIRK